MQAAVQKVHRPSEKNSQLPTFSLIMYDAGDIACDVSRVTTKAPCEMPAIQAGMCAKESQLPFCTLFCCNYLQLHLFMYDAGDSACDVSRVTTKAPCKVPAIHGRHVCKGITTSVLHTFSLQLFTVALIESCIFCKFVICCQCTMIHTTRGGIV